MKIAIVTHCVAKGDGQGRVNYELVRFLLRQGLDVELIATRVDEDLLDAGATWTPVRPHRFGTDLVTVWDFTQRVNRLLAERPDEYDLVLACGVVLSCPHTVNVAHFVHGTWLESPYHSRKVGSGLRRWYHGLYTAINARWERHTFAQAEVVVAVSDMVRRELIEIGVPADRIEVIVNGVDLQEFAPGPADRSELGLPEAVRLGLFVGDLCSPIKNLDTVLHELRAVPSAHLAVAGRTHSSPYPALAEELEVADRVHFLDFRRDVADLMRASDFFVLPSRRDSCPLVLLEAMASGLPILTATTVGISNLVAPSCGFVMDGPADTDTLRTALNVFVTDPNRSAEMGRAARRVAEGYGWEHMAQQYLTLFKQVAPTSEPLS